MRYEGEQLPQAKGFVELLLNQQTLAAAMVGAGEVRKQSLVVCGIAFLW
jgi:hypothetical protein